MTENEKAYMLAYDELESVRKRILRPEIGMKYSELCALEDEAEHLESIVKALEDNIWLENETVDEEEGKVLCPGCSSENVIHSACGDYNYRCTCSSSEVEYYCGWCNLAFESDADAIGDQTLRITEHLEQLSLIDVYKTKTTGVVPQKDCSHLHQVVTLPDGTEIRCTAGRIASKMTEKPDFGLYADQLWIRACTWRNEMINWPDMQLPQDLNLAIDQIEDAFRRAEHGEHVDIGCIGAHGRTGTILAIMALLATEGSLTGSEAVQWVWDNYCKHAIETKRQEWYVEYAAGYLFGYEIPDEPKTTSGNTSCGATEHLAMKNAGLTACPKTACNYWATDMKELAERGTISTVPIATLMQNSTYQEYLKQYGNFQ